MYEWISRQEAADLLAVSTQTIDRYRHEGALPSRKIGTRTVRIRRDHVLALLQPPADTTAA